MQLSYQSDEKRNTHCTKRYFHRKGKGIIPAQKAARRGYGSGNEGGQAGYNRVTLPGRHSLISPSWPLIV